MLPKTYHLVKGDTLLAVLENCEPSPYEMFWQMCDFRVTEAFTEVKPLFDRAEAADPDDVEAIEAVYEQLRSLGVRLISIDVETKIDYYILWIDDNQAYLRYSETE